MREQRWVARTRGVLCKAVREWLPGGLRCVTASDEQAVKTQKPE